jgi:hypothetical protein
MNSWRKLETGIFVPDSVAGEWEHAARLRYVAHVDMLGMSGLTIRNPRLAWGAVSKITEAKKRVLGYSFTLDGRDVVVAGHVAAFTFSDTILLFTKGDDSDDLRALLIVCLELFAQVLHGSIPVRMGIAHGLFVFNGDEGLFVGPPLVEAYRLGEEAQWIGAVVDDMVAKRMGELSPELLSGDGLPLLVEWQVPIKTGAGVATVSREARHVLAWPWSHRRNFHDVQHPIPVHDFYRAFEQLFGEFSKLPRRDQAKYENTVGFVNAMLASA